MTGELNIAVAGFSPQGDEKITKRENDVISSVFFNRLISDIEEISNQADIVIQVLGPDNIPPIKGSLPEKREENAELLAKEINADIIFYGSIEKHDNSLKVTPEFFVDISNFYEAEEMVGQHALGNSITIANINSSQVALNRELSNRAQVVSFVTRGLSFYFVSLYEDALNSFQEANRNEYWQNNNGRESIYLFEGNAAGKMLELDIAEKAYQKSIDIQPNYSRGYVGLGSIFFLRSIENEISGEGFEPNPTFLAASEEYFNLALEASYQPKSADISSKVAFGLGQIYLIEWFAGKETLEDCKNQFQIVLRHYNEEKNPRIQEFASESYARLGIINKELGMLEEAINDYKNAVDLATNSGRRGLYLANLANLYDSIGDKDSAIMSSEKSIEELRNAISLTRQEKLKAIYWDEISLKYEYLGKYSEAIDALRNAILNSSSNDSTRQKFEERLEELEKK
jgi:tetratricopeptide (TPR) repeat protein